MKTYLVRGVPMRLQQDGWWLNPPPDAPQRPAQRSALWHLGLLAVLVAAGDVLMWSVLPGLSLAVFAGLCMLAAMLVWPRKLARRTVALAAGITVLSLLPLVELVQPLSLMIAAAGLPLALLCLAGVRPTALARFWVNAPIFAVKDSVAQLRTASPEDTSFLRHAAQSWTLPLSVGCVFGALLLSANPVLSGWAEGLLASQWAPDLLNPVRILFWTGLALLIWPCLGLVRLAPKLDDAKPPRQGPRRMPRVVNAPSIMRSLALFNAMFAVQNGIDFAVLAGGAGLPEGMTFAEYAHRGAYPLIVLALLSGGFALLARPFIPFAPWLKAALLIWVAQTVWLTCSSLLRLELYVEAYGLTRLRLAAGIWMGLVMSGLCLTLWQIAAAKPNLWLLKRVALLGVATLYACSFLSFDRTIARYNVAQGARPDDSYLCQLGEAATPVISSISPNFCEGAYPRSYLTPVTHPTDWREWGFRNARTRHSMAQLAAEARAQ